MPPLLSGKYPFCVWQLTLPECPDVIWKPSGASNRKNKFNTEWFTETEQTEVQHEELIMKWSNDCQLSDCAMLFMQFQLIHFTHDIWLHNILCDSKEILSRRPKPINPNVAVWVVLIRLHFLRLVLFAKRRHGLVKKWPFRTHWTPDVKYHCVASWEPFDLVYLASYP